MTIAIHYRPGSFSDRWIEYCKIHQVGYRLVNAYDSDILSQLNDCEGFMWHWYHDDYRDQLFARQLIQAIELKGIPVFPNSGSAWHYDDKIAQKYLLESIRVPLVPSYVFYEKKSALQWAAETRYPKVFKLRGGAGSQNVILVKGYSQAKKLIDRAFGRGFLLIGKKSVIREALWIFQRDGGLTNLLRILKRMLTRNMHSIDETLLPVQRGYIYFQDFIPDNAYDDRLVVVGGRCFAIRRHCRKNDFRASGSGIISYDPASFPKETIELAFHIAQKLNTQSVAFDFIYDEKRNPLLVEISYSYTMGAAYDNCQGYWNADLKWHETEVNPQFYIIDDFINSAPARQHP